MSLSDARVLITGASGFIGSHLARACVREGAEVTCLFRHGSNPWRLLEARQRIAGREVDFADKTAVAAAVTEARPDVIFHLAASTNRKRDLELYDPLHAAHVSATLNLVSAALKLTPGPRFIHTGTIEEYGRGPVPFREDQREEPITPYSLTKLAATNLVSYAAREHGLPATIVRPSLTYGPLKGKGMFIPDFIHAALTTKKFGMSPGEQTRDFMYVDDAVRAFIAIAAAPIEKVAGEIFNVATGAETKLKDVAERLRVLCGGDTVIDYGAYPCNPRVETMRCFMDTQKICARTSWRPTVALDEGLAQTVGWYLKSSAEYDNYLWL